MSENETAAVIEALYKALDAAEDHLDYCGYGDSYEREGAFEQKLPEKIIEAKNRAIALMPALANMV